MLGLLTIVAYGSWYYSFGVLFDPIRIDTGWSESLLATAFSVGIATVGLTSALGGLVFDRRGSLPVFAVGGVGGAASLLTASYATHPLVFVVASAAALGFLGSLGFYHITMTAAVRVNPSTSARAIAVLTIWGAFASALYLPLTATIVDPLGWRVTIRVLAAGVLISFFLAALVVRVPPMETAGPPPSIPRLLRAAVATADRRAFTLAVAFGGAAMSTVLVYQVPTMSAAGLPLATAATLAGVRGFCQIGGRVPLAPLVGRLGSTRALVVALGALAVGGGLLAVAGNIAVGLVFAVITGFGIGAFSPLQGIKTEELYDRDVLGAAMGFNGSVLMVAGAAGPALAGPLADATGDRRVVAPLVVFAAVAAAVVAGRIGDPTEPISGGNT